MLFFTVVSLSTDGFGIVQGSQLSQDFRTLISESLPIEFILPINQYLEELALATIPAKISTDVAETASPETENEDLAVLLAEELVEAMLTAEGLATPQPTDTRQTPTARSSPTPSAIPTSTSIPTQTSTPISVPTSTFVWYPWTSTPKPPANQNPSCVGFNHSNPQTTGVVNIGLSALCSDPDGDLWTITSVTQGTNGSSTFGPAIINYDPNDGFAGTDNLTFTINDGKGGTHTQSFDVIIANWAPSGINDSATVFRDSGATLIDVLANDTDPGNDPLTITNLITTGTNGTVIIAPDQKTLTYTPPLGFTGSDSFIYSSADPHGGVSAQTTVNITVNPIILLYSAGSHDGDLGNRAATNALCAAAIPAGYTNSRAFIAHSTADSIANMPANYSIPTNIPIQSTSGVKFADNWADLLDGNIANTLTSAGLGTWWSGAENADGSHIDGTTEDCNDWTSISSSVGGKVGLSTETDSRWMANPISAGCHQALNLLCLAYP